MKKVVGSRFMKGGLVGVKDSVVPVQWHPHPYQLTALEFMLQQRSAGLFLDPG